MTVAPLGVSRPMSIEAVDRALAANRMVLLLLQKDEKDDPGPDDLQRVGTVAIIRQMAKSQGGMRVIVEGTVRARAEFLGSTKAQSRRSSKCCLSRRSVHRDRCARRRLQELVDRALSLATGLSPDIKALVGSLDDPLRIAYLMASLLDMKRRKTDICSRRTTSSPSWISSPLPSARNRSLELKGRIESKAEKEMTDAQRGYLLRQQMKAIQSELGEGDSEIQGFRQRVEEAKLPEQVETVALREVERLERMTPASPSIR